MRSNLNLGDDNPRITALDADASGLTLGAGATEQAAFRTSEAGFPLFAKSGRKLTTAMVRKAEEDDPA